MWARLDYIDMIEAYEKAEDKRAAQIEALERELKQTKTETDEIELRLLQLRIDDSRGKRQRLRAELANLAVFKAALKVVMRLRHDCRVLEAEIAELDRELAEGDARNAAARKVAKASRRAISDVRSSRKFGRPQKRQRNPRMQSATCPHRW